MNLLDLINGNNYGVFNRQIARLIGLNTSIVLSEFIDKFQYFSSQRALVSLKGQDGLWFYLTAAYIEERTTLTEKEQRSCIEKLISLGFIKKVTAGLPAKRYFQLDTLKIFEYFKFKLNSTNLAPGPNLDSQKVQTSTSLKPTMDPNKEPICKNKHIHTEEPAPPPSASAAASGVCKNFIESIKEINPKFKDPNLEKWEREFDCILNEDKRDLADLYAMIKWVLSNPFWKARCLSPANLRKNYDTIYMQMNANKETEEAEYNRKYCLAIKEKFPDRTKNLTLNSRYAMNLPAGKEVPFSLPRATFKNAFLNMMGASNHEPNRQYGSGSEVEDTE